MEGQVVALLSRAVVVHDTTGENIGRARVNALLGCWAGQHGHVGRWQLQPPHAAAVAAAAVRRSPTFLRSCCAAGRTSQAHVAPRQGLASSSSGAGSRRARTCPRHAPKKGECSTDTSPSSRSRCGASHDYCPYTSAACRPWQDRAHQPGSKRTPRTQLAVRAGIEPRGVRTGKRLCRRPSHSTKGVGESICKKHV